MGVLNTMMNKLILSRIKLGSLPLFYQCLYSVRTLAVHRKAWRTSGLLILALQSSLAVANNVTANNTVTNSTANATAIEQAQFQTENHQGSNSGVKLKTPIPTLIASPSLCELSQGQTICTMNTTLIWEVPRAGHYCLQASGQKQFLQCWENSWSGTHQLSFESGDTQTYLLVRHNNQTVAATTSVQVTTTLVQRLRAKRRRSVWRIF